MLSIELIPVLEDNYIFLLRDTVTAQTAVVDPAESMAVIDVVESRGWHLDTILNTHHHGDHVGGNLALKKHYDLTITGPKKDQARIPGIDLKVVENDEITFGHHPAKVIEVEGHTRGHIAYWFYNDDALFCGDTLFAMGCGRLFEGTPEQMWASLQKFRRLPPKTLIYCAHEYTETNGRFALSLEPDSQPIIDRMAKVRQARHQGQPTIPTRLDWELQTNPFLRVDQPDFAPTLQDSPNDPVNLFAEIRRLKDDF